MRWHWSGVIRLIATIVGLGVGILDKFVLGSGWISAIGLTTLVFLAVPFITGLVWEAVERLMQQQANVRIEVVAGPALMLVIPLAENEGSLRVVIQERETLYLLERDGKHERIAINLTDDAQRCKLARILESEIPLTLHTREFDFYAAFLKLTGEEYN